MLHDVGGDAQGQAVGTGIDSPDHGGGEHHVFGPLASGERTFNPWQVFGQQCGFGAALELDGFDAFEGALVGGELGEHELVFAALHFDAEWALCLGLRSQHAGAVALCGGEFHDAVSGSGEGGAAQRWAGWRPRWA